MRTQFKKKKAGASPREVLGNPTKNTWELLFTYGMRKNLRLIVGKNNKILKCEGRKSPHGDKRNEGTEVSNKARRRLLI